MVPQKCGLDALAYFFQGKQIHGRPTSSTCLTRACRTDRPQTGEALDNILVSPPINGNVLSLGGVDGLIAAAVCMAQAASTMEIIELMFERSVPEFENPEAFENSLAGDAALE